MLVNNPMITEHIFKGQLSVISTHRLFTYLVIRHGRRLSQSHARESLDIELFTGISCNASKDLLCIFSLFKKDVKQQTHQFMKTSKLWI